MKKELKVFVVSPSDVSKERNIVKEVCSELNGLTDKIKIEAIIWEDIPLDFIKNPQENINNEFYNSDIYIVILWYKLGTKIKGATGALTKEQNVTGTQYEIEYLIANKKENVLFYIKEDKIVVATNELIEAAKQQERLKNFLEKIDFKRNNTNYSYFTFKKPKEFKGMLKKHLIKKIEKLTDVNIEKIENFKTNLKKDIHPNYWVFLYGIIAGLAIISFIYITQYAMFDKSVKYFLIFYIISIFIMLIPLVNSLPTNYNNVGMYNYKEIAVKLLKRVFLILFFSLIIAIVFYLSLNAIIRDFINFFKSS